ncbi:flagellar protein FlaG [Clostridium tyrobutyricum]|uniref:flagellar protein FlaG n=1 Tax=Clostridium tyrobutyricum TaxID=1519 RepID=UPI0018AAAAEC|nr:flagellar protein FlaG [Clostridium tyrobutyricum]
MEVNNLSQGRQLSLDAAADNYMLQNHNSSVDSINSEIEKIFNGDDNKDRPVTEENVKKAVDKFNSLLEENPAHFEYEIYGKFRDTVIKLVDNNTKKVIKEIPPKNIIDMVEKFCELAGFFVNEKV